MKKAIIVIMVLCITALSCSGCLNKSDVEEYKDLVLISIGTGYVLKAGYETDRLRSNIVSPEIEPIKLESDEFTFRGITYHHDDPYCLSVITRAQDKYSDAVICSYMGYDPDENKTGIKYVEHTNEVVFFLNRTLGDNEATEKPTGIDNARSNAIKYIEDVLNDEYDKNIKFSQYELVNEESDDDGYKFMWVRFVNNVAVHTIKINTTPLGNVYEFEAMSVPERKILRKIPNFTKEDYIELARDYIIQAYKNSDYEANLSVSEISLGDTEYKNVRLEYLSSAESYVVCFPIHYIVTVGDSDNGKENDLYDYFYLPLT